jgi:hypothetical protein
MADEAGLLEAPTDAVAEIDAAVSTEVDAASTEVAETGQEAQDDGTETTLKGSALWREVKSLEAIPPKLKAALNKVIHRNDAFESKYPDGLSAIEAQMNAIKPLIEDESVPFEQAIEQTVQERNYFRELDGLFTAGKPEFVDKMAEASPEAFQNIAPSVFRKYAEVNPEGYSAYVAQAVVQHMNSAEVPLQFRILASFLPQLADGPAKEQVLNAVESLYGWSEGLKRMASTKIEPKAIPQQQNGQPGPDREAQLAEREQQITLSEWNSSIRAQSEGFVRSEAVKAAGKAQLTEQEHQKVLAMVKEEYTARLIANRGYTSAAESYVKAGNKNSYIQRVQSEQKKILPGAVRRAVGDVIEARPKNAPKQSQAAPTGQKKPVTNQLQGAVQYRKIAGPPRTLGMKVDLLKTTHGMLEKRQAILEDGSRVTWGAMVK